MRLLRILPALLVAGCNAPSDTVSADNAAAVNPDVADRAQNDEPAPGTTSPPFAEVPNAHPSAPEPAPIPARFRGTWADSAAACADRNHHSRLTISGRTLRFPQFVIFGDSFTFPGPNQFALKGKIETSGRPADAHYSVNTANDVLTDEAGGGAVRVRCR